LWGSLCHHVKREASRFIPSALIGASLIVVLRFRPAGLLPERLPRIPVSLTSTPSPENR